MILRNSIHYGHSTRETQEIRVLPVCRGLTCGINLGVGALGASVVCVEARIVSVEIGADPAPVLSVSIRKGKITSLAMAIRGQVPIIVRNG